jgi:hypothetical protein
MSRRLVCVCVCVCVCVNVILMSRRSELAVNFFSYCLLVPNQGTHCLLVVLSVFSMHQHTDVVIYPLLILFCVSQERKGHWQTGKHEGGA